MSPSRVLRLLLCTALVLTLPLAAMAGDNPFRPSPPFKTAIIKYAYSGNQSGEATTYFKGDTRAEYKHLTTKVLGFGSEDNQIIITSPKRMTTIDLKKNEAFYTGNYMTYMAEEYDKLSPAEKKQVKKNAEAMGKNFMAMMGGKPQVSQGKFMGKPVDIVSAAGMTSYTWRGKNVVLKQKGSIMGVEMNMTATQISVGVPVPSSKLKPPAGITPQFNAEADQKQREMAHNIMNMLKDPNAANKQNQAMQDAQRQAAQAQAEAKTRQQQQGQQQGQEQQGDAVQQGLDAVKKIFKW
ncbi:MAG: hypothetical protein KQH53_03555 [Desulfarculaceae bacterium]|nr:hypothetical protein [Desulfarculaceae bacterium]